MLRLINLLKSNTTYIECSVGHNMFHLIDTFTNSLCCFPNLPYQVMNLYTYIKNQLGVIIRNNINLIFN